MKGRYEMKTTPTMKPSRHLALFTAIIMALTLWTALPLTASAADLTVSTENGTLTYTVESSEATITSYAGEDTDLSIPATVGEENYPVTAIGEFAFQADTSLTSIKIPKDVTFIDDHAFIGCTALNAFEVDTENETFVNTRDGVLLGTISITANGQVVMEEAALTIVRYPQAKLDTEYAVPDEVAYIKANAFRGNTLLQTIKIPDSVTYINQQAFEGCTALAFIDVDENNTSFFNDANGIVFNINKTTLVYYPEGIATDEYTIPEGITTIATRAFLHSKLGKINMPYDVKIIERYAFFGCENLSSIILSKSVTTIDYSAFRNCDSLTAVIIPDSVTNIDDAAFRDCDNLTSITILGANTTVNSNAFSGSTSSQLKIWCYIDSTVATTYSASGKVAIMIDSIALNETKFDMDTEDNDESTLTITYAPEGHSETDTDAPTVEWSSSNEDVAEVDKDGEVTAKASGTALITATVTAHSEIPMTATCEVTVAPAAQTQVYKLTVNNGTFAGTGSGDADNEFAADAKVTVIANDPPFGQIFAGWTDGNGNGESFAGASKPTTVFTMPAGAATVTANYKSVYALTVENGTDSGDGSYAAGDTVTITAGDALSGKVFDKWTTADGVIFANANSATTSFTMPAKAVTVTANYKDKPVPPTPPAPTTYTVTVTGGSGSGSYAEGDSVNITANAASDGHIFDKWTSSDVSFANASSTTTSFTMPAKAVTVTANYKDDPNAGGGDPDDPDDPDNPPVNPPDNPPAGDSDWVYDDGVWYLVDADGQKLTGWQYNGSAWYYLAATGVMETGWVYDGGTWYYLAGNGAMKTGWIYNTDYKAWFYFSGNGKMKTGWVKDDGNWYYLAGNGAMVANKWFKDTDGSWYYLSGNGKMLTGKQTIGGKIWTFKSNGAWVG
jgi:hypothetical protein